MADIFSSAFCPARFFSELGPLALDHCFECSLSRLSVHHPFRRPVWFVCLPSWIQFEYCTRAVARMVFAQSAGWHHRWVPMVSVGRAKPAQRVELDLKCHCDLLFSLVRHSSVPEIGKKLRRPNLKPD